MAIGASSRFLIILHITSICWTQQKRRRTILTHSRILKHTTTLFALSDHYILRREWRVIVNQVHRPIIMEGQWYYNQSDVTELLIMMDPHYQFIVVACVLSRLKPS